MNYRAAKKPSNDDCDQDDRSSHSSPRSMRSCNVVLKRADLSQYEHEKVAHNTRQRRSSHLTADNLATLANETKRTTRATSIASDDTATTSTTATGRRASSRLAAAPKTPKIEVASRTPKKEVAAKMKADGAPRTPSRGTCKLNVCLLRTIIICCCCRHFNSIYQLTNKCQTSIIITKTSKIPPFFISTTCIG